MAYRLAGTKPLSEPILEYCQLDPCEQISVKSGSKFIYIYIFIQENAFENVVWKMAAILARPQCVKTSSEVNPNDVDKTSKHEPYIEF